MENKNNNEQLNDIVEESNESIILKIEEIEHQMLEISMQAELLELEIQNKEDAMEYIDQSLYQELADLSVQYKKLKSDKRDLSKQIKSKWDKFPAWMFIYGIFQIVFSVFYVMSVVSLNFATWFLNKIVGYENITRFWEGFGFFFIPFISLATSTVILFLIKDKTKKIFFLVIFGIQTILTLISVGIMISFLVGVWN